MHNRFVELSHFLPDDLAKLILNYIPCQWFFKCGKSAPYSISTQCITDCCEEHYKVYSRIYSSNSRFQQLKLSQKVICNYCAHGIKHFPFIRFTMNCDNETIESMPRLYCLPTCIKSEISYEESGFYLSKSFEQFTMMMFKLYKFSYPIPIIQKYIFPKFGGTSSHKKYIKDFREAV